MEERDFRDGVAQEMEWIEDLAVTEADTGNGTEDKNRRNNDRVRQDRYRQDKYRLTGALWAKIVAFILLGASGIVGILGLLGCIFVGTEGFYEGSLEEVLARQLRGSSISAIYEAIGYIESGDIREAEVYCRDRNVDLELVRENRGDGRGEETVLWSTWDGYETKYITEIFTVFEFQEGVKVFADDGALLDSDEEYLFRAYVDPDFPIEDNFRRLAETVKMVYEARFALIGIAATGILLCILMFVFLMCGAGHRNGREGIVPGVLATIPFDVLTFLFGCVALLVCALGLNMIWSTGTVAEIVVLTCVGAVLAVWGTLYCMEFATRLKRGNCFRYSLIYMALRGLWRICRFLGRGAAAMLRDLPLVMTVATAYLGLCIMEFLGILLFLSRAEELSILLWCMEKVAVFAVVIYIALACRKLLVAGRALAEGEADYKVDTSRLVWSFQEHGENLNSLGQGISKAVAERMRSERLKTELITNVSHDLKTPLTSIINYADLICEETAGGGQHGSGEEALSGGGADTGLDGEEAGSPGPDMSRVAEYAEVLLRQSRRLKKLLEDLLEASKATTGNLEVNLEPCEVGVLLSQAVGEYQQRMEEKQLNLITRQPEEIAPIMADGRHLWRVFDNLLNNICKYAQENSRVYLSVEQREGNVTIIFRNMSKYPLDISVEELEERFVRGDKSRHMEGNGLGLSIAKSLVELQGGRMEITIDGDLFKVLLRFAAN